MQLSSLYQRIRLKWPDYLAWTIYCVAVFHTLLLFWIIDPVSPQAIAVRLLQPLAASGAIILLIHAARCQVIGRRRVAITFQSLSSFVGLIANVLLIRARARGLPVVAPLTETLYAITYAFSLIGTAVYFPRRIWWYGNGLRLVFDSLFVGFASLVLMQSVLPTILRTWAWTTTSMATLTYLAFDIAILFAASVLGLRYGRNAGPLLVFAGFSFFCLFMADMLFTVLSWLPGGERWHLVEAPLYSLQSILFALGAYRSIKRPPQIVASERSIMPTSEWLLWLGFPRVLFLIAVAATIYVHPVRSDTLALFLCLGVVHELAAAIDQRRVFNALHQARESAHGAESQLQAFLDRIIHDLAGPVQALQTTLRQGDLSPMHLQQLAYLVQQLRTYQQARYYTSQGAEEAVDMTSVCAAAIDAVQDRADQLGIAVCLEVIDERVFAVGTAGAIRRVIDNLLANALPACSVGDSVILRLQLHNSQTIRVEVEDTGCGISFEQQAIIFNPLVRYRPGGLGLGLAIVRELMQSLNGQCGITSIPGQGSIFWLKFIRAKE